MSRDHRPGWQVAAVCSSGTAGLSCAGWVARRSHHTRLGLRGGGCGPGAPEKAAGIQRCGDGHDREADWQGGCRIGDRDACPYGGGGEQGCQP